MIFEGILIKLIRLIIKYLKGVIMEKIIAKIVENVIARMSPQLRDAIEGLVEKLETVAKETKNPWDDLLVIILKVALGME